MPPLYWPRKGMLRRVGAPAGSSSRPPELAVALTATRAGWAENAYDSGVSVFQGIVVMILQFGVLATAVYAFVHAAIQRADAYAAAGAWHKPVWLAITGAAVALPSTLVFGILGMSMAACAAGVYIVDVRPKLLYAQGKSR